MNNPSEILKEALARAISPKYRCLHTTPDVEKQIENVCICVNNRAAVRLVMACLLANADDPDNNPTKPYTKIGSDDCFSGRAYDEKYLSQFITDNNLPCNSTTAFLTPALRNIDQPLSMDIQIVGRPQQIYSDAISLLHAVQNKKIDALDLLVEIVHRLTIIRNKKQESLARKLEGLQNHSEEFILSSEDTIKLINQHLACKHSSRLPVLIIAAAYNAAQDSIREETKPLLPHNAADEQTGSMGDIEICLVGDDQVKTVYEMKMKKVLREDIDRAIQKIVKTSNDIDNYIFITTEEISEDVSEYAASMYESLGQREIAILDCHGFLRHFLHFFHRLRHRFLDEYQKLVISEPESAVSHELKEVFLQMRQIAETR